MSYIVPRDKPQGCMKCPYINQYNDCRLIWGSERIRTVEEQYQHCPLIEEAHPRVTRLMLDQAIRETAYVLECIATLKSIQELGDCNTCGVKGCQYRPDWGKPVRYNCPHYEAGNEAE